MSSAHLSSRPRRQDQVVSQVTDQTKKARHQLLYGEGPVEDPLLTDYREDVSSLLLQRGEPHNIDDDDELVIAACFDRGQLVSVCATRVRSARDQRSQVISD